MNTPFSRTRLIKYLIAILLTATLGSAKATVMFTDSARLSLLTCSRGDVIYSLFGHTGIRYEDTAKKIDVVFNYGIFSFGSPNFTYRFAKGVPNFMLGLFDSSSFVTEYLSENRTVWQQTLDLTNDEKKTLITLLQENYQPQNRMYRYNYFFDNCATRPRDLVEKSICGKLIYPSVDGRMSFRNIVHESARGHEWDRFGMDLCLGVGADRPISYREEMFAPLYLMDAFARAVIKDEEGRERPLVSKTKEIVSQQYVEEEKPFPLTPMRSALLLFICVAVVTIYGLRRRETFWGVDLVLFAAAGLAGCVIAFLSCFSEHPAVSPNYLIFVFHPLHLLLLPLFLRKEIRGYRSYYHLANAIVLTLFIAIWPINPQYLNLAVLPLALCLLVRSLNNLVLSYNMK